MTPADLETAARLLFGEHTRGWQRPLARALQHPMKSEPGIDNRLVRRWMAGEAPIPEWVPDALRVLVAERRADLDELEAMVPTTLRSRRRLTLSARTGFYPRERRARCRRP